ncbi:MAG TPA: S46 family peptidase [Clostridia bacterium]|nr:S46 family peptidase [Clostridia bacterium]
MKRRTVLATLLICALLAPFALADEGLWLFNAPPAEKIKAKYGFTLTQPWLDHVRESAVRFNNGGSGSFVSPHGLAFTNHHVAADCLSKVGTSDKDYIKLGFYAKTQAEELKCPDLELNVLTGIEDVTPQVQGAAKAGMSTAEIGAAQRAVMSQLEADCAKDGQRCDVVTLYSGGAYHLYKYKRYMDVRLVFAPEYGIASFGGDADNFEFPRYALDVTFFRIYENDKPVQLKDYYKWSTTGVKANELVFMAGNPGSTARLNTMAQMEFNRDVQYPLALKWREAGIKAMKEFAAKSPESARITASRMFSLENSQKSQKGYYAALLDKQLMTQKAASEKELRASLAKIDPTIDAAWPAIEQAMDVQKNIYAPYALLERMQGFDSGMAQLARTIVRAAAERQKPNSERIKEYRQSALPSLEQALFSTAPVYDSLEIMTLTHSFMRLLDELGAENATVKRVLGGKTPAEAALRYVTSTKLKEVAFRKTLYEGGTDAVSKSDDPMIVLMRDIDADARALRRKYEDEVDAVVSREGGRIAQARFKLGGMDLYPDATFTLRLSYGAVRGYTEDGRGSVVPKGTEVPYFTVMGGAFDRERKMGANPPYQLPPTWTAAHPKMKLNTPMDFASTADSIGGNSGSPILNVAGEVVGINFDRNMQGLGRNFYYSETGMRHIAVDARGILEALRSIYGAQALADELTGKAAPTAK